MKKAVSYWGKSFEPFIHQPDNSNAKGFKAEVDTKDCRQARSTPSVFAYTGELDVGIIEEALPATHFQQSRVYPYKFIH